MSTIADVAEGLDDTDSQVIVVMTNLPDVDSAARLTRAVLEARAAACVNRLAPVESEYWWQGKLEQAQEWPLLIKTTRGRYAALEAIIREQHPYDVPEIIAWPLVAGLAPYLAWVQHEVRQTAG